jgi:hypothetical protein
MLFLFKLILRWRDSEVLKGRLLAVEARTAHDRFGLTHTAIVREAWPIRKVIRSSLFTPESQSHGENLETAHAKRMKFLPISWISLCLCASVVEEQLESCTPDVRALPVAECEPA